MKSIRGKNARMGRSCARVGWRFQFQAGWARKGSDMVTFDQRFEAGGRVCQAGRSSTKIPGWACAWLAKGTALWLCRGKEETRVG